LEEIRELGYTGSANLLVRYLNQGRAQAERAAPPPRRLVGWIMSRPAELPEHERSHFNELLAACLPLTVLADHVRTFADLPTTRRGAELTDWMTAVEASDLPALHAFVRGLRKDLDDRRSGSNPGDGAAGDNAAKDQQKRTSGRGAGKSSYQHRPASPLGAVERRQVSRV
jgi:hypothetical protein